MANSLDNAIARLQNIAEQVADSAIGLSIGPGQAQDYPNESIGKLPKVVAHVVRGSFYAANSTTNFQFPVVSVDFLMSRANLQLAYKQTDAIAYQYPKLLAGDPTLDGNVTTILFTQGQQISYEVGPIEWDDMTLHMISFQVPLKLLESPSTSST